MTERDFDASTELVEALTDAYHRFLDAFDQRYLDRDLSGRGEDWWAEFRRMAGECRRAIDVVQANPYQHGERWVSWLNRMRVLLDEHYLTEGIRVLDKVRPKIQVAHFRTLDVESVVHVALSFAPCDLHNQAIDALDDEHALLRVARNAGCNGAKRHAAERLISLFPEREQDFRPLIPPSHPKPSFAERVGPDAAPPPPPAPEAKG